MVTKNEIKFIKSLQQKKYRNSNGLFIVEGIKGIQEFLRSSFELRKLFVTEPGLFGVYDKGAVVITEAELNKISSLKNPNKALALFELQLFNVEAVSGLTVALDDIRDPGNLGTIIRLCDWFGVRNLICSEHTVDCYNPKVVQATMGSLSRVNVGYVDLPDFLGKTKKPVYAADMNGANVYTQTLPEEGILVMGNEANGLSEEVMNIVSHTIAIPRFGSIQETESLNVATATAILLSEFKRGSSFIQR